MKTFQLFLTFWLLTGCSASPNVTYIGINEAEAEGYMKFHLLDGSIVLSQSKETATESSIPDLTSTKEVPVSRLSASVVPKENGALYAVIPKKQWFGTVDTNISATFYDNTRLVHKIGIEVFDNRTKVIEAIGAATKAAVALAPSDRSQAGQPVDTGTTIVLPVIITPDVTGPGRWHPLPNNEDKGWFYRLAMTSQSESRGTIITTDFFEAHRDSQWYNPFSWWRETSAFPLSSCQDYSLEVSHLDDALLREFKTLPKDEISKLDEFLEGNSESLSRSIEKRTFGLRVPDSSRITTLKLPSKGELITHTLCGGNVSTQTAHTSSAYDLIGALIKQAQSINEAQKKDKK